jgi:hypothetical protein
MFHSFTTTGAADRSAETVAHRSPVGNTFADIGAVDNGAGVGAGVGDDPVEVGGTPGLSVPDPMVTGSAAIVVATSTLADSLVQADPAIPDTATATMMAAGANHAGFIGSHPCDSH